MCAANRPATLKGSPELPVPVTVVIPTLNEADRLPACLASVRWAAQLVVVDAGSSDATREIARAYGAQVIESHGCTIGEQKNLGIAAASQHWVLSIDADERVSDELRASIECAVRAPYARAYRVHLRNRYLGAPYMRGSWARDWHVRLYPTFARWSAHAVHEKLDVSGEIADLAGYLDHDSYRDLPHQMRKSVTYAEWGAADLAPRPGRVSLATLVGRPAWRFVKTYLLQGMWRDGIRGFVFCTVHAWSCFAKYALLWERQRKDAERARAIEAVEPVASASREVQVASAALRPIVLPRG